MVSLGNFDAREVKPAGTYDPLPAGKYKMVATRSEMKDTKTGGGKFLEIQFEVVEGEYKGRRLTDRLNLVNSNSQAVEIARSTLSAICHATGVMQPKDSSQLHNIPLIVKVALEKRKDNGEDTNRIKGYEAIGTAAAEPVAVSEKAPWE